MATIRAIEGRSVHQIQSGQVIVDLCSVIKELVENSLDAGATSIDVKFKNHGLEAIEVQDNGSGIAKDDFETIGLKHYTSKLATFEDLNNLNTFGFRGEALSSLCALANVCVMTAQKEEAPRGSKLEFEVSGRLKSCSVTACQKGTTVTAEGLFQSLPVRRRELEKNVKREYSKVLGLLQSYACVCTGVRLNVSNQTGKGKKMVAFQTSSNQSYKENIANVFGAKATTSLVQLDLSFEMRPSEPTQSLAYAHSQRKQDSFLVHLSGQISKPTHGEGRLTPDRQMFFVNSRPCNLPQVAKAFNEVYKSYNLNQSPFIFANLKMDTAAYDVNVSPDKRTIMLHDQSQLLEALKESLYTVFEAQEHTVPQTQLKGQSKPLQQSSLNATQEQKHEKHEAFSTNSLANEARPSRNNEANLSSRSPEEHESVSLTSRFLSRRISNQPFDSIASSTSTDRTRLRNANRKLEESNEQDQIARTGTGGVGIRSAANDSNRSRISRARDTPSRRGFEEQERTHYSDAHDGPSSPITHNLTLSPVKSKLGPVRDRNGAVVLPQNVATTATDTTTATAAAAGQFEYTAQKVALNYEDTGTPPLHKRRRLEDAVSKRSRADPTTSSLESIEVFSALGRSNDEAAKGNVRFPRSESIPEDLEEGKKHTSSFNVNSHEDNVSVNSEELNDEGYTGDNNWETRMEATDKGILTHNQSQATKPGNLSRKESIDEVTEQSHQKDHMRTLLVQRAEDSAARPSEANQKRAAEVLKRCTDSTMNVLQNLKLDLNDIRRRTKLLHRATSDGVNKKGAHESESTSREDALAASKATAEEVLSLSISKADFTKMRIVGQFNLGFIIAVRAMPVQTLMQPEQTGDHSRAHRKADDLFIIDQHASDEIYNFSRLALTTHLTPQPLVRPHTLELTAIEEETIFAHKDASLARNGFNVAVDLTGESPVGRRCRLLTLPTSKETVFDTRDLEELLVLLGDVPAPRDADTAAVEDPNFDMEVGNQSPYSEARRKARQIVRPSKVRRMLAMRACRSSIMIGRPLTARQMSTVVGHMGEIERPWNCPHGRPTMRHLTGLADLGSWDEFAGGWDYRSTEARHTVEGQNNDNGADADESSDDNDDKDECQQSLWTLWEPSPKTSNRWEQFLNKSGPPD